VIGGGLAGAAAAWGLARSGHAVTLVEGEERPGVHASGRNAGMIRRVVEDPAIAALAEEGARLLADPPSDLAETGFVRRTGSVLLAPTGSDLARAGERSSSSAVTEPSGVSNLLGIEPRAGDVAIVTPDDGVADPHEILSALLDAARRRGATVRFGALASIVAKAGRICGVELAGGAVLEADVVVNAGGPWAADLVRAAGGLDLDLLSFRRHLVYTGPLPDVDPDAPWVWDTGRGFYVRPESSGLLLCACDADLRPPEDARPDEQVARERLARKVHALAPSLEAHPVARCWAGLRTFAADGRFLIGWDARIAGLFWLTGLGGHGLTVSCALADLVADGVEGEVAPVEAFDPGRFEAVTA
jgi:D-arginine dehydrogenase